MDAKRSAMALLEGLEMDELLRLEAAGEDVMDALQAMTRADLNPLSRILPQDRVFYEDEHYPDGDIYDRATGSQYYYHAHRSETGEHGHLHTFIRAQGIPAGMAPAPYEGPSPPPSGDDAICHLVAVSMDASGLPTGLFTTNRWVTAESYFLAADVEQLLEAFTVDHADPCWATNRFVSGLVRLFRPQIVELVRRRDRAISDWREKHCGVDVFEDRGLEVTSDMRIDIDTQIEAIAELVAARKAGA